MELKILALPTLLLATNAAANTQQASHLYWGDTHLHTSYSFDAFLSNNQSADPDTAYRWAKGSPVIHPYTRAKVQVGTPLDFLVVSDHAEALGVARAVMNETQQLAKLEGDIPFFSEFFRTIKLTLMRMSVNYDGGADLFQSILPDKAHNPGSDPVADPANILDKNPLGNHTPTVATAWSEIVDAAERHNEPGKFTAFVGWEWRDRKSVV